MRFKFIAMILAVSPLLCGGGAWAEAGGDVPALKVTSRAGKVSTLIGSVHVRVEGLRQPDVERLFKDALIYVVEGVPGDGPEPPPRKLRLGMLKDGQLVHAKWATDLNPGEVETFEQRLQCNVGAALPPTMSVSEAALVILSMGDPVSAFELAVQRCPPPGVVSRDAMLAQAAAAKGVATVGLERAVDVEQRRLSVPEDVYARLVKAALRPGNELDMQQLVEALNKGDYDQILRVMTSSASELDVRSYLKPMLDDRNQAWLGRLREHLDAGGAVINVGAGHLGGKRGLISLLQAEGFLVEPILVAASAQLAR